MTGASYTFDNTFYGYNHHNRNNSKGRTKEDDGNSSLTYSAASVESNDSSFAGILRALEQQGGNDFVLTRDRPPEKQHSSNTSVSGYSTDGESYLAGTDLLQTIAGQPSSEFLYKDSVQHEERMDSSMVFESSRQSQRRGSITADSSPSSSVDTPTKPPPESPPMTRRGGKKKIKKESQEGWFRTGCCFAEAFDLIREMPDRYK
eukprot:scaffold1338_cov121-Cylindrotheca_fusiformis.AAC.4